MLHYTAGGLKTKEAAPRGTIEEADPDAPLPEDLQHSAHIRHAF